MGDRGDMGDLHKLDELGKLDELDKFCMNPKLPEISIILHKPHSMSLSRSLYLSLSLFFWPSHVSSSL